MKTKHNIDSIRRARNLVAVLAICLAIVPPAALADGGFWWPGGDSLHEYEQVALLDWDADSGTETLVIMPGLQGDAEHFAWIIPVPAVPSVAAADRVLFEELVDLTRTVRQHRDNPWQCQQQTYEVGPADAAPSDVDVLRHELVGIYDTMVIQADDADALVDSLRNWSLLHEANEEASLSLLQDYVDRGWTFVTLRVDSTALDEAAPASKQAPYYYYVGLEPIELTFATDEPVYPLRISSLSAWWRTSLALFVCADHRLEFPDCRTTYANRVTPAEHAAISRSYPRVAGRVGPGRFLTRLANVMGPADMTEDLLLTPAADDAEFRSVSYSGLPLFGLFVTGSLLTWAMRRLRRRPTTAR